MSTRDAKSFAIEGAVIVLSILLAFAIDAAWAERVERGEEERVLDQFAMELERYGEMLELAQTEGQETLDATEVLLRAIHEGTPLDGEAFVEAMRQTNYRFRLASATASYELLAGSGTLGLISDAELRGAVSRLAARIAIVEASEAEEGAFVDGQLRTYMQANMDDLRIFGLMRSETHLESRFTWSHEEVLSDREFSNLLVDRRRHASLVFNYRNMLRRALADAQTALEQR